MKTIINESDLTFCTVVYQACLKKTNKFLPKEIRIKCLSYLPSHRFMIPKYIPFNWDMDIKYITKGSKKYKRHKKNCNKTKQVNTKIKVKNCYRFM